MKKISRSLLPNSHEGVDTLPRVEKTILKNIREQEQREIITALTDILQKYRECEEKTETRRNDNLVHYITDRFQELLKPYIDNFAKTVDLQLAVREIVKSKNFQEKVADEVFKSIKASIRKLKKESVKTSGKQQETTDFGLDDALQELTNLKKVPTGITKKIDKLQSEHTSEIIKLFRKNCKDYAKKNARKETGCVAGGFGNLFERIRKKQLEVFKKNSSKRGLKRNEKTGEIRSFQNIFKAVEGISNIVKSTFAQTFRILGKIGSFIKKVASITVGAVVGIITCTVKGVVSGIRKMGGVLVSTLKFFRIDKILNGVVNIVGDIAKITKKALKNSFYAIIRTPVGMFAIGYALGCVWGIVKKYIRQNKELGIVGWLQKTFEPQITLFSGVIDNIKGVFNTIYHDFIKPVLDFIKPIASKTADVVGTMFGFVLQHPVLVTSVLALLKIVPPLLQILGPAAKILKCCGSPLSALIAAGILASAFVIPRLFRWMFGGNKFELANEKSEILSGIGNANKIHVEGLSQDERQKYDALTTQMNTEESELSQLLNDINNLRDVFNGDDDKNTNLNALYGDFVKAAFDSELFGFDKAGFNQFRKNSKNKTVNEQLEMLAGALLRRYDRLVIMKNALATSESSKHLQYMMNRIANFDNGKVVASDVVNKLNINTKDLRKDRWYKPWDNLQEELRKYTDIVGDVKYVDKKTTYTNERGKWGQRRNVKKTAVKTYDAKEAHEHDVDKMKRVVPGQNISDEELNGLIKSLDDKEGEIVRNEILSNYGSEDISRLKKMSFQERKQVFDKIIAEWRERNQKLLEERKKDEEKRKKDEIMKLDAESQKLEDLNEKMRKMIAQRTGTNEETK